MAPSTDIDTARPGKTGSRARTGLALLVGVVGGLLVACTTLPPIVSDDGARATATAVGCFSYGSYPHGGTLTPTPTGTWPTLTPTPIPPTMDVSCDLCTVAPRHPWPPAWPPPATTCTPPAGVATVTPAPTEIPHLAEMTPAPPLQPVMGWTDPAVLYTGEGLGRVGGVAVGPAGRAPVVAWSQLNPFLPEQGRVLIRTYDPGARQWRAPQIVNEPGYYKIGGKAPEVVPAVVPAANGGPATIWVAYPHSVSEGGAAVLEVRASRDGGATWAAPVALRGGADGIDNLRVSVDPAGRLHLAAVYKTFNAGAPTQTTLVYFEQDAGGGWITQVAPVSAAGGRVGYFDMTTFPAPGGGVRTVLIWTEGEPPDPETGFAGGPTGLYTSYKDDAGAWQTPTCVPWEGAGGERHCVGSADPPGGPYPDYQPGFTGSGNGYLRLLAFPYNGQWWTYSFWSLYSNGRIAYSFSADAGSTWEPESALAVDWTTGQPPTLPADVDAVRGSVHNPTPFWDAQHGRVWVLYTFQRRGSDSTAGTFISVTSAPPGVRFSGGDWQGGEWTPYQNDGHAPDGGVAVPHAPVRLFAPTVRSAASELVANPIPAANGYIWLIWQEAVMGTQEVWYASLNPATLLSPLQGP